jgi:HlyD family secretion protein
VVYISEQGKYAAVEVEVLARNPDEAAVKGLAGNAVVTTVEPDMKDRKP